MDEDTPEYFNVAFTLRDWVEQLDLTANQDTSLNFDLFGATALVNLFDAFATGAVGIFKYKTFLTKAIGLIDIPQGINFAASLSDTQYKLLYALENVTDNKDFLIATDIPAKFLLRYAVIDR